MRGPAHMRLALTDAERTPPRVIRQLDIKLAGIGLVGKSVQVRMTGCPNGCARPYNSEIGLVGHRSGRYDIHLRRPPQPPTQRPHGRSRTGGGHRFTLLPVLVAWRDRREEVESFGDFCHGSS